MQTSYVQQFVLRVYNWLLIAPLKKLYFGGPLLYGFGFWGGREPSDICAELTNVGAEFWHEQADRCDELLEKQFSAFLIAIETVVYLYLLFRSINFLLRVVLWKMRIAPESWRRTPPLVLDRSKSRGRSPQAKRRQ